MSETIKLLRIYTDESAYWGDQKVYSVIAERARAARLAGVTVLQALFGFGRSAHTHRRHVLESEQALVIEIVDAEVRLREFVLSIAEIPEIGLITLEAVEVLHGFPASVGTSGTGHG